MSIWRTETTTEELQERARDTLSEHLAIRFTEIGPDYLRATMPVHTHTHQPTGVLHGGASVALAETLGSVGANLCVDRSTHLCMGQQRQSPSPRRIWNCDGHGPSLSYRRSQPGLAHRDS
jgi:1,4-dihydroxy-2-naphthoyl-CoA hydrolase